jgi:uncharacterized protein YqjF (DUF2071 family)
MTCMETPPLPRCDRPLFIADWDDVRFLHFELDPLDLQPSIPFELDVRDGRAYVSLVAFTQRRLRPVFGGRIGRLLAAPLSDHAFLNVRTYVRHRRERGIYFIEEWIPNRLASWIGPRTYGLPYRLGELDYEHNEIAVRASKAALVVSTRAQDAGATHEPAALDSLAEFLLERYVAFTSRRGVRRRFAVRHAPWLQTPVIAQLHESTLLNNAGEWFRHAHLCAAQQSPGVVDVEIGAPQRL